MEKDREGFPCQGTGWEPQSTGDIGEGLKTGSWDPSRKGLLSQARGLQEFRQAAGNQRRFRTRQ